MRRLVDAALHGDDRTLAVSVAPQMLACRSGSELRALFNGSDKQPHARDFLAGGVVLSWSMDAEGAFDAFRAAHDRAIQEERFELAVGARERLAHHALLFGEIAVARAALDDALALATARSLSDWFLRCASAAARLALDNGDARGAESILARAAVCANSAETRALLAPAGVALAAEAGDGDALASWSSPEILHAALHSSVAEIATAATIAMLCANTATQGAELATALRRALLCALGGSECVELFSLAARYGDLEEARLAAEAPSALPGPNRRYIKAHAMLARAHLCFRSGERAAGIDHAGDAARAFNAMGMRRWMDEAMMLLVRQDGDDFPKRRRGRPVGSALTGREQQVAHLIRRGARNREVAAALQISEHTVERHVSSILGRLGLRSRWQIVDPKDTPED